MALVALVAAAAGPAAAQQPPPSGACATPDTVAFRGYERVAESALRGDVAITPGVPVNYRELQRAIKSLYATAQFDDIQVKCEVEDGRAMIVFELKERLLLAEVDVRGPVRVPPGTVRDQVDILVGRPIDPSQVTRVLARIDSVYAVKGYYLAQARAETTTVAAGTKVTFVVDEGNRLAVSGIQIAGNAKVGDREVVGSMQTKPEGFFWWKKGEFDDDKYAGDLTEKIPEVYGRHGFIDLQVERDTLVIDRERGKALVDVAVSEGPQYVVGAFEVNGARRFSDVELRRFYPFTDRGRTLKQTVGGITGAVLRRSSAKDPENVFDQTKWDDATRQVQDVYMNEGYIYAQVRPVIERVKVGPDSVPTVNLRWDIDERTPAIVNRVDILGNDITVEACIRDQILMLPGDVFSRDLLMRSYQSISQMQFFETPLPEPDTHPANEQGDIDIIFRVREKKTGNVNFGASVGQGTGVGGFIGFDQPNLFGLCKRGSLQWQFGKFINDFNLSYTDPRIRQSRVSGTATIYHTRSRFTVGNLGRTTRAGGQIRFGFPVARSRWTRVFVDYGGESVKYGEEGLASTISCGTGTCFRSSVGLTIDRDTRIDMPFPSAGAHQMLEAQFNGGPLGGTAAYQRYKGELRGYATLATFGGGSPGSQPLKLVTGLTSKGGALFGNPGPFFIYQQFSLGGVQYGEALRGYEEFSITPLGYALGTGIDRAQPESFGSAFFTTSAELGLRVSQQLYLSSFFDVGNVWARARDFNPTRLFRGAGFGASLITPLGPLGLDMGYGFDRLDQLGRRAPAWQAHFKFGQFF